MGFVAIHDSFFEGWVYDLPPGQRCVLLHCIRRARWKHSPGKWRNPNGEWVEIPRGSFKTTYRRLAEEVKVSVGCVQRALKAAREDGMILIHGSIHTGIMITLSNYATYQDIKTQPDTRCDTSTGTRTGTLKNHIPLTKKKEMAPPTFPQLEPEPQKLPWSGNIPWFKTLFWFEQIKGWEKTASNICEHCIGTLGMTWPILQEKLQASSEYLEDNQTKYKPKGARQFYANQVAGWENRVPPDRATKHRADNGGSGPERLMEVLAGWSKQEIAAAQKLKPS